VEIKSFVIAAIVCLIMACAFSGCATNGQSDSNGRELVGRLTAEIEQLKRENQELGNANSELREDIAGYTAYIRDQGAAISQGLGAVGEIARGAEADVDYITDGLIRLAGILQILGDRERAFATRQSDSGR
jgi:cell division septum initiation protein DivIVA